MSVQLDKMEKQLDSITQLLGGDQTLGQKGLVEDHREMKKITFKNKEDIGRFKWLVTGIVTLISTIWAAAVAWAKDIF